MPKKFDVIVIGGGPGGYVGAIRAAQLGLNTALIEKRESLGGTCLNVGCIPSKALLDSSEHYYQAKHKFTEHGIDLSGVSLNLKQMMKRKNGVVSKTVAGLNYLIKKNKITRYLGTGSFVDAHTIRVAGETDTTLSGEHIIIATGSEPASLPFAPFDGKRILSSTEALELPKVPEHLLVVGGGFIGLEIGSVYARLGAKVTVIEFLSGIIPVMDHELGAALQQSLSSLGFEFHFNTRVTAVDVKSRQVRITAEDGHSDAVSFSGDYALIAIGRKPYTDGLNLAAAGIATDKGGRIEVDDRCATACATIYAIGDVVAGPMLAHKAEEEGVAVAEIIAGQRPHINHDTIPGVVYTWPEVASVGRSEEQLRQDGVDFNVGKFPFAASGRARAADESEGFIKVLSDKNTDEILGVHMIGPRCSDMIAEAVVAMEFRASAEDIARITHAHPTFTESFKEAALAATGNRALHL